MAVNFQIGQCRIHVDLERTKKFYETLPRISENCTCSNCAYFENEVIKKDIRLFKILSRMGVDLSRQPNINPDGICFVGDTEKFKRSYIGYYKVFGELRKTQRLPQTKDEHGKLKISRFF